MKSNYLRAEFVEFIPKQLSDGVIYVSQRYRTATHRCCCGCGNEVVTPLGPADWTLQVKNYAVTLYPSIGNWSLPCRSHYFIRNGSIVWAASMTQQEIQRGRVRDRNARDIYIEAANQAKENAPAVHQPPIHPIKPSEEWLTALWRAIKKHLGI
jgi:hypothetical protein